MAMFANAHHDVAEQDGVHPFFPVAAPNRKETRLQLRFISTMRGTQSHTRA
jgi:hypothetical protein